MTSGTEIRIWRWLDLRVVQEKSTARWIEHRDRSGDVGWPFGGRRAGILVEEVQPGPIESVS